MAKLKMKNICIVADKSKRKRLMADLQKSGLLEISQVEREEDFELSESSAERTHLESLLTQSLTALDTLKKTAQIKSGLLSSLNGRREITFADYDEKVKSISKTADICGDINELQKQITQCQSEILRLDVAIDEMQEYTKLDIPTNFSGTTRTKAFVGSIKGRYSEELLNNAISESTDAPFVSQIIATNDMQTKVFVIGLKKDEEELSKSLSMLGFARASGSDKTAEEKVDQLKRRRSDLKREIPTLKSLICEFSGEVENIEFLADFYAMRIDRYKEYDKLLQSKNTVIVSGYAPERDVVQLEEIAKRHNACIIANDPTDDEDVPVELKNNGFSKPSEGILRMYSAPSKTDVDPTAPMSFFFYLFFGLMLSDAGYGIILVLGCIIGLLKFNLEDNMKNNLKMFLYCGISTIFWGAMFGGWFGDLVYRVTNNFFGAPIVVKPIWLDPLKEPMTLLIFGLALGVVHIFTGMIINFINLCRNGKVLSAFLDVGTWLVTLSGVLVMAVGMYFGFDTVKTVGISMLIGGAVLLICTQGRDKKGFGKIIGGIASLYDITSYASDILSYSRVMALGLATGVLAQVVNILGTMQKGIIGVLMFIVIFLFGTAISLSMNALGAYVHTIRLQYVEFFNKFYEGGGRFFKPFSANTRFIRFKKPKK